MSASALYLGQVVHQRHRPKTHRLAYRVFSLLLDLDELSELDRFLRWFGHNRWVLCSFLDRDHGAGEGADLKDHVRRHLRTAGIKGAEGPIRLLCSPRVLGYVFNPLSVFYCYDWEERLRAIIYEVNNTHGERHSYVFPVRPARTPIRHSCAKRFFVSPFLPLDCHYNFHLSQPGAHLRLLIYETHQGAPILDAWFSARGEPLTDRNLLQAALRLPLLTVKIILGIHWEALKLYRKVLPVFKHPPTPKYGMSFGEK